MRNICLYLIILFALIVIAVFGARGTHETATGVDARFMIACSFAGGLAGNIRQNDVFKSDAVELRGIPANVIFQGVAVHRLPENTLEQARELLKKFGFWRWRDYNSGVVDVCICLDVVRARWFARKNY